MKHLTWYGRVLVFYLWGTVALAQVSQSAPDLKPTGKGWGEAMQAAHSAAPRSGNNGIFYHGGPLILGTINVHYIWYGDWSGNTATAILDDFAGNLGGSPYFNINSTYYDGSRTAVTNSVLLQSDVFDNYSRGAQLSDADVQAIVAAQNPTDTSGVYFVLTSADVAESSGFCTQYCGWHQHAAINGLDIKFAFVGNADRCPSACAAQSISPNGNAGADAMASVIAHELEESVTDPHLDAWYDRRGQENADKCAWTFGATYTTGNGSFANMKLGTRDYLIQRNWVNAGGGYCDLAYPSTATSSGNTGSPQASAHDGTNPWPTGHDGTSPWPSGSGGSPAPAGHDGTNPWPKPKK